MSALASSGHGGGQTVPDSYEGQTVDYTDSLHVLNPEGSKVHVTACGRTAIFGQGTQGQTVDVKIPQQLPCGLGTHQVEWDPQNPGMSKETFEFTVESTKSDPNKGYYIVTRFGLASDTLTKSNTHMEDFFLTNTPWYDDDNSNGFNEFPDRDSDRPIPKGAFFMISEADRDANDRSDEGVFIAKYGNIITGFDKLIDHSDGSYGPADGGFAAGGSAGGSQSNVYDVFGLPFDNGYTFPLRTNMDNKCSISTSGGIGTNKDEIVLFGWPSCAPVHENGNYQPQGEIIVASEMDAGVSSTEEPSIRDSSKFFICRDAPGSDYTGNNVENSKLVKVQKSPSGSEWKYYRCSEDNDWVEVECPPGKIFEPTPQPGCVDRDAVYVEASFFDLQDVPEVGSDGEILAGFKITQGNISKYEAVYDQDLKNIDAECWMGQDDERPNSLDDAGTFTLDYDGTGDAWVLGYIPYRSSKNTQTYSCVWGFSPTTDTGIYDSTREPPVVSVDGGRESVSYQNVIKPKYQSIKGSQLDESVIRDIWNPYTSPEDMFSDPDAHPYCTTPSFPPQVLDNIDCS